VSGGEPTRQRGLGKGLAALLGDSYIAPSEPGGNPARPADSGLKAVPIELLRPGAYQPRHRFDEEELEHLADSIREKGLLQPILVRALHTDEGYEIVAGERRWRAAQRAGLHEIPVIVRSFDDQQALEVALVENLQRQNLNPLEEAEAYHRLMQEFSHTPEAIGHALGRSRSHIANIVRLLDLPETIKNQIAEGALSMGHARALLGAPDPKAMAALIVAKGLSVRQTEQLIRHQAKRAPQQRPRGGAAPKDPNVKALEDELSARLGLAVSIKQRGQGGQLVFAYRSLKELDEILRRLR
jgi:ParB family chromosome partitioning protein